jgi:hypothetical protein
LNMKRIVLIGCGKLKLAEACAAKDLYVGRLFIARRDYAERSGHPWLIISARHGLVNPDHILHPYNKTMPTQRHALERWAEKFKAQYLQLIRAGAEPVTLEVHAGADYVVGVRLAMFLFPIVTIEHPIFGMGIGEQISFYNSRL